jgi:hypothetical protein
MADRGGMRSAPDLKKLHPDDAEIIIVNSIRILFNPTELNVRVPAHTVECLVKPD